MAGMIRLQTEAATITPAAKPVRLRCRVRFICPFKKNTKAETSTPYDDVHRTMLNDCPKLIIPVVNEMFQKKHSDNEKVTLLNNELFINRQNGKQVERITDTNLLIGSIHYHLECQSTADGTIMYRMFEYDSQIALQSSEMSGNKLIVKFVSKTSPRRGSSQ